MTVVKTSEDKLISSALRRGGSEWLPELENAQFGFIWEATPYLIQRRDDDNFTTIQLAIDKAIKPKAANNMTKLDIRT